MSRRRKERRIQPPVRREPSPPEPAPAGGDAACCALAENCGGCSLIGSSYAQQLVYKRAVLAAVVGEAPELAGVPVDPCLPSSAPVAYRNRAKLAVRRERGRVRLGLFQRGTNRIVAMPGCQVHRPVLEQQLGPLVSWIEDHALAAPVGPLKYVDLREAIGGSLHLTLVVSRDEREDRSWPLDELAERGVATAGICLNLNPDSSSYVFGETTRVLRGDGSFTTCLPGLDGPLRVPATGFLQVNSSVLPAVHGVMEEHLGGEGDLHDLFCGVGVHGLRLIGNCQRLFGYELQQATVEAARINAGTRLSEVSSSFVAGPCEETFRAPSAPRVVLNPGRSGCRPELLDRLLSSRPERVAYLSCNPRSLVRDLRQLVRGGLRVCRLVPVDMMPQTDQIEALALLAGDHSATAAVEGRAGAVTGTSSSATDQASIQRARRKNLMR